MGLDFVVYFLSPISVPYLPKRNMKKIELIEHTSNLGGRPYHVVYYYKSDKRFKSGRRKVYLIAEWLDELPYVKFKGNIDHYE